MLTQFCVYSVVSGSTVAVSVKRVTPQLKKKFTCRKCEGNIGEAGRKVI